MIKINYKDSQGFFLGYFFMLKTDQLLTIRFITIRIIELSEKCYFHTKTLKSPNFFQF